MSYGNKYNTWGPGYWPKNHTGVDYSEILKKAIKTKAKKKMPNQEKNVELYAIANEIRSHLFNLFLENGIQVLKDGIDGTGVPLISIFTEYGDIMVTCKKENCTVSCRNDHIAIEYSDPNWLDNMSTHILTDLVLHDIIENNLTTFIKNTILEVSEDVFTEDQKELIRALKGVGK